MIDPGSLILSQYESSPTITTLLSDWNEDIDPRLNLRDFYEYVWNITTATSYGLDIWGRIVGAPRSYILSTQMVFLWFSEASMGGWFGLNPMYNGAPTSVTTSALDDATYRKVIVAKALANCSNCSATTINALLQILFSDSGVAYAIDNLDGTYTLRFKFSLSPQQKAIVNQSGVFPRPAGVAYTIVEGA